MRRLALNADILADIFTPSVENMAAVETWLYPQKAGLYCEPGSFYVDPELVLEVAFNAVHPSPRHKSGVAVRFPEFIGFVGTSPPPKPTASKLSRS